MKTRAIKTSPHFDGMFEEGTEVEMINVPYEEDTILVHGSAAFTIKDNIVFRILHDEPEFPDVFELPVSIQFLPPYGNYSHEEFKSGKWIEINKPVIAKKGSMKELHFKLPDGRVYDTDVVYRATGKHFADFFEKI